MIGRVLCWLALVALTVLPIILRSRGLRILSVVALLFAAHSLLWSGLRLAARNADFPDRATLTRQVVYADAWRNGLQATQANADAYLVPLTAIFVALGILALSPAFKRRSQSHAGQVSSDGASGSPPDESDA